MEKTSVWITILAILIVIFAAGNVYMYSMFTKEKEQHTLDKTTSESEIKSLKAEISDLRDQIANLERNLSSSKDETRFALEGHSSDKEAIKSYLVTLKTITEDQALILQTIQSAQYISNTPQAIQDYLDELESQIEVAKDHIDKLRKILEANTELFEDLSLDIEEEVDSLVAAKTVYDYAFEQMKAAAQS